MAEGRRPDTKMMARRVIELLEADLVAGGYDLLDVRIFQGGGRYQVRIFVDTIEADEESAGGVTMGLVAKAARTAGMLLEEADLFAGEYIIEVSSPGIRRPLRKPEHFQAAIGERVDLKVAGSSRVRGVLKAMDGEVLTVELPPTADATADTEATEPALEEIELHRVIEGNLDPEFDAQALINADRRRRKETKRRNREEKAGRKKKGRPKNRPKDRPE